MVCVPCIVVPFLLWVFHKFISPWLSKFWSKPAEMVKNVENNLVCPMPKKKRQKVKENEPETTPLIDGEDPKEDESLSQDEADCKEDESPLPDEVDPKEYESLLPDKPVDSRQHVKVE
ncbi:UPF0729 protein CG18508-like [Physella acuta]|uniref:UPF0729 protein CG18508-like n=1 Tax=Physella acuta TaxID=109671 RepID=UPI0027DE4F27|nr:UPF0729 protein CG18508-like [Physella acuta]XP_059155427.1 UPF0729 protein CG18508-like [Physella acuta]XP_059155428.1 UPF0729 protein CG18508-like [Physella acuta]